MAISLKAARINAGFTQSDVADKLGVNLATVSNWETGKTSPSIATVQKLVGLYSVGINDIDFTVKE